MTGGTAFKRVVVAAVLLCLMLPGSAAAQSTSGASISISPAILSYTVNPGNTFDSYITVGNVSSVPMAIRASAAPYVPEQKVDEAHEAAYDASSWIKIPAPDVLLLPSESKRMDLKFTVPTNAEPGSHYSTVYFESFVPDQVNSAGGATVSARVGAIVTLTVSGELRNSAEISPIDGGSISYSANPKTLSFTLRNTGNVHYSPKGFLRITDIFGKEVKRFPLDEVLILPGTEHQYQVEWEHGLQFGKFKAEAEMQLNEQKLTTSSGAFWLLPLVSLLGVAMAIGVVAFVATAPKRRKRRREKARKKVLAQLSEPTVNPAADPSSATQPADSAVDSAADSAVDPAADPAAGQSET